MPDGRDEPLFDRDNVVPRGDGVVNVTDDMDVGMVDLLASLGADQGTTDSYASKPTMKTEVRNQTFIEVYGQCASVTLQTTAAEPSA